MPSSPHTVMVPGLAKTPPSLGRSPSLQDLESWRVFHQVAADTKAGRQSPELTKVPERKTDLLSVAGKVTAAAGKLADNAKASSAKKNLAGKLAAAATPPAPPPAPEPEPVDEEMWKHTAFDAAESKWRRTAEIRFIAKQNALMRKRLDDAKPNVNNKKDRPSSPPPHTTRGPSSPEKAIDLKRQQAQDDEALEVRLLREMLEKSSATESKGEGWNNSTYRREPYAVRGLRPMFHAEPWSQNVIDRSKQADIPIRKNAYATSALTRLDDKVNESSFELYSHRVREDKELADKYNKPVWDARPWKYCPSSVQGLKPMTREPWTADLETYERPFD